MHLYTVRPGRIDCPRVLGIAYPPNRNKSGPAAQSTDKQSQSIKPAVILGKHRDDGVETSGDSGLCQSNRERVAHTHWHLEHERGMATRFRLPRGGDSLKGMPEQWQVRGVEQGSIAARTQIEADVIGAIPRATKSGRPLVGKRRWWHVAAHADADPDTRCAGQARRKRREARHQRGEAGIAAFLRPRRDGAEFNAVESRGQ